MIAHEIHEQLYRFKQDRILDRGFEPEPLYTGFRPIDEAENWAPVLETLTTEEYEKILEANDRSIRYSFFIFIFILRKKKKLHQTNSWC